MLNRHPFLNVVLGNVRLVHRAGTVAASSLEVGERFRNCPKRLGVIVVPAGKVLMGAPPHEEGKNDERGAARHEWSRSDSPWAGADTAACAPLRGEASP